MRRHFAVTLAAVILPLLACSGLLGKKTSRRENEQPGTPSATAKSPLDELPSTATKRYDGKTVDFWGPRLSDLDYETSQQAAVALRAIGQESLRYFAHGLESEAAHVRGNSVHFLPTEEAKRYPEVFAPRLQKLLRERSPYDPKNKPVLLGGMRFLASTAIRQCGFKECLPALAEAIKDEPNPNIKATLERDVQELEKLR